MEKPKMPVEIPVGSSRAANILLDEIKRLTNSLSESERLRARAELSLEEITNDRDRFARRFREAQIDRDYWKQEAEQRSKLTAGRVG